MTASPKCDIRVYGETRNSVIYTLYICDRCGLMWVRRNVFRRSVLLGNQKNKNDERLYQGSEWSYYHCNYRSWKKSPCFRLDRKRINIHFDKHRVYLPNALVK